MNETKAEAVVPKWTKHEDDGNGAWWEADVRMGEILVGVMVSCEEESGWGYTLADGGGATIANVDGFESCKAAMRGAVADLCGRLSAALHLAVTLHDLPDEVMEAWVPDENEKAK